MEKDYIVTKSNRLITCNYDLTVLEQKIILTLASMVQPQDTEFKEYEFKIKDFINLLGLQGQSKYTELPKITRELKKKVFDITEGTDTIQVSWLGGVRYKHKEGILILQLEKNLKPYMLELNTLYTSYKLQNILNLKSKYSIRLYEILKSNLFKGQITIELEELKNMTGAKEKAYSIYNNVKSKVLMQAQKELSSKTDISFEFEEIKTGRKVTSLKFYISTNKTKNMANEEACTTLECKSTNKEEKSSTELINKVKNIFKENITVLEAKFILDTAKSDINIIKEKYDIVSQMKKVDSVVATMIDAIRKDYQAPKGKEKVGSFNDYDQRNYDLNDLERKLLGWDKEEKIKETGEEFQQLSVK
ncbi:RepB family plasmid replication initiator protein [Clostridium estertheticum]|uniref:RepB family plasmid replication initiator protein n=1 Tax=Clostridium estertheticum TaxID=238834 RepID=A0A5N7J783_9CLOT|nr:RepB family plasmid replication initiator protein [Clostridium estertheticum]MPQ64553.1 RepB family plasmid replication initiator protein [Clostridium estertheticum]